MFEENGVTPQGEGEGTPGQSPAQTPEQEGTPAPGENPSKPAAGTPEGLPQHVPYERFKEVNDRLKDMEAYKTKAEMFDQMAPLLESLNRPAPPEKPDFSQMSPEEYVEYVAKNAEEKFSERERALRADVSAQLEARTKLAEAQAAYPELKSDKVFREFVIMKMGQNPKADIMELAKETRDYFAQFEGRGREAAKQEFLEKGSFQGKPSGNNPHKSNEEKEFVDRIVNAGGKSGIF